MPLSNILSYYQQQQQQGANAVAQAPLQTIQTMLQLEDQRSRDTSQQNQLALQNLQAQSTQQLMGFRAQDQQRQNELYEHTKLGQVQQKIMPAINYLNSLETREDFEKASRGLRELGGLTSQRLVELGFPPEVVETIYRERPPAAELAAKKGRAQGLENAEQKRTEALSAIGEDPETSEMTTIEALAKSQMVLDQADGNVPWYHDGNDYVPGTPPAGAEVYSQKWVEEDKERQQEYNTQFNPLISGMLGQRAGGNESYSGARRIAEQVRGGKQVINASISAPELNQNHGGPSNRSENFLQDLFDTFIYGTRPVREKKNERMLQTSFVMQTLLDPKKGAIRAFEQSKADSAAMGQDPLKQSKQIVEFYNRGMLDETLGIEKGDTRKPLRPRFDDKTDSVAFSSPEDRQLFTKAYAAYTLLSYRASPVVEDPRVIDPNIFLLDYYVRNPGEASQAVSIWRAE